MRDFQGAAGLSTPGAGSCDGQFLYCQPTVEREWEAVPAQCGVAEWLPAKCGHISCGYQGRWEDWGRRGPEIRALEGLHCSYKVQTRGRGEMRGNYGFRVTD